MSKGLHEVRCPRHGGGRQSCVDQAYGQSREGQGRCWGPDGGLARCPPEAPQAPRGTQARAQLSTLLPQVPSGHPLAHTFLERTWFPTSAPDLAPDRSHLAALMQVAPHLPRSLILVVQPSNPCSPCHLPMTADIPPVGPLLSANWF